MRILMTGATGLVGQGVLREVLLHPHVSGVGVLGALTTYSALMLECLLYAKSQRSGLMFGYLAITLVAGLALVWLGARVASGFRMA